MHAYTTTLHSVGSNNYKWTLNISIYQQGQSYKYVLSDKEDDIYIGTNYLTPATANDIDALIEKIDGQEPGFENIHDVFLFLSRHFAGGLFYERSTISPQLTDGVILLTTR